MAEVFKPFKDAAKQTARDAGSLIDNLISPVMRGVEYTIKGTLGERTKSHIGGAFSDAFSLILKSPVRLAWAAVKGGSAAAWNLLKHTPLIMIPAQNWRKDREKTKANTQSRLAQFRENLEKEWKKIV